MKKIIYNLFVAASLLSFVFVNYNAVNNTVSNSSISLTKLFSISFANAEVGNCVYCNNSIDNCTCDHVDACPSAVEEPCYVETGKSVTDAYTTTSGTVGSGATIGFPEITVNGNYSTGWTYVPEVTTTHYEIVGYRTDCMGPENDPNCFSTYC